jgi:predicted Zn finger-like uncharacterized protein
MSTVRLRRLQADYQRLQEFVKRHPRVELIQAVGSPPEQYQLQYQIRSLRQKDDRLVEADTHLVEITLPRNYPRVPPQCRMLTPIFHPNIAPHAICIGDHWSAGEPLSSLVARIGELLAYQSYNTKSPLNGEAARWTSENLNRLPLDPVSMLLEDPVAEPPRRPESAPPAEPRRQPESAPPPPPSPPVARAPRSSAPALQIPCPECGAQLRASVEHLGKRVRCPRCTAVVTVPWEANL